MSKTSTVRRRTVGSVVGLLVGGVAVGGPGVLLMAILLLSSDSSGDLGLGVLAILVVGLGSVIGGTIGAAKGAAIMQKPLGQRSPFWRALLVAVVGMLIGIPCALTYVGIPVLPILIVAGAVIGSGWKAKTTDAAGTGS